MERIICFGGGYKDFAVYIALTLNNMGYAVLIDDRSEYRELAAVISCEASYVGVRTYRNIDFCFGEEIDEGYDYIISYFSKYSGKVTEGEYKCMIINTQVYRSELAVCQRIIAGADSKVILILRDIAGNGADKKYIGRHVIDTSALLGVYEIRLDIYDKEYQYRMDYDGIGRIRYISGDYEKAVIGSLCSVTDRSRRSIRKALKYVKEGRIFDNRLLE